MSIWVDKNTKLLVQRITGAQGAFHAKGCRDYGTQVVAGTNPKKAGTDVEGIPVFATVATVVGLSNASRRALTGLSVTADFRWHQLLSAEDARTYKPDPAMYELAMSSVPETALPPFMVAAHAWDLRAAKAVGMRTAYVPRPNADGPRAGERFDLHATSLEDLEAQLRAELP